MSTPTSTVRDLPDALRDDDRFVERVAGRRLAVFLDYDGVLTPIVDRQHDRIATTVDALLAEQPDRLKVTPGKMVYEQPLSTLAR